MTVRIRLDIRCSRSHGERVVDARNSEEDQIC